MIRDPDVIRALDTRAKSIRCLALVSSPYETEGSNGRIPIRGLDLTKHRTIRFNVWRFDFVVGNLSFLSRG